MTTASTQGLRDLVQARAGLFNQEIPVIGAPGDPRFSIAVARLGDLRKILPGYAQGLHGDAVRDSLDGAGSGLEAEESSVRAVAEGLERYSSCVYDERQFIWATGNELGDSALDLATVPQCSEAELRHPRCPIEAPSKKHTHSLGTRHLARRWPSGLDSRHHGLPAHARDKPRGAFLDADLHWMRRPHYHRACACKRYLRGDRAGCYLADLAPPITVTPH